MKIRAGLLIIIILSLLYLPACEKEDLFAIEPSVFYETSIERNGTMRVFNGNGEIEDPAIVNRFVANDSLSFRALGDNIYPGSAGRLDSIRFVDSKQALLHNFYAYAQYDVTQEKTEIFFKSQATYHNVHGNDLYSLSPAYWICKYKPMIYSEYLISSTAGNYAFGYDMKNEFVVSTAAGTLKAPWIVMIAKYSNGYRYNYLIQNFPDFDFFKSLKTTDTVVLRQYWVTYKKR